jgi:hypothetical protein
MSVYQEFMAVLRREPDRPINITIDWARFQAIADKGWSVADFVLNELTLWSSALGNRAIPQLRINHPYQFLEPFDLTRTMHILASKFRIASDEDKMRAVVSGLDEISPENLALIKGLGFNCYQVAASHKEVEQFALVQKKVKLLREFAFDCIGIQMTQADCLPLACQAVRRVEPECHPDYICLGGDSDNSEVLSTPNSEKLRTKHHYGLIDTLELGPEGVCHISDFSIQNYCSAEKYKSAFDVSRLPVHIPSDYSSRPPIHE